MLENLWGALPLAAYAGLVAGQVRRGCALAEALLRAAVFWSAVVWGLANALGLFDALRSGPLRIAWVLLGTAALADGFWRRAQWSFSRPNTVGEWGAAIGIGALLLLALVTAVLAPPVTVDVLNYHLPRQLMWLQQGSLAPYVTVNDRELMMPPLAEVIGLQWLALTGDDRWANLPQWFAYALLPLAMIRAARAAGLARRAALLAAWLAVCLPMAWHEASNGKNDLQCALWLAVLLWQVTRARSADGPPTRGDAQFIGLTVALAALTKSTALFYAPPLLVAGWFAWRRAGGPVRPAAPRAPEQGKNVARRGSLAWQRVGLAALVAALLTAPFFARNFAWYGTPLGVHRAEDGGAQANTAVTPALIASNVLRNSTLHLSLPSASWNAVLDHTVRAAHGWLGISVDDPRSTLWAPVIKYGVDWEPEAESVVGAPIHFALIAFAVGMTLLFGERRSSSHQTRFSTTAGDVGASVDHPLASRLAAWRWLAAVVAAMAVLYCVVLKWQPWGARLQLPIFVTGALLVAGLADTWFLLSESSSARRRNGVALGVLGALGLLAWWPSHETNARPLWTSPTLREETREINYYRYHPDAYARDVALAEMVRVAGVREVAVAALHDNAYPLMRRLQHEVPGIHFHGAPAGDAAHVPEAILALMEGAPQALWFDAAVGVRYRLVGAGAGDGLYLPEATVHALGWEQRLPAFAGWTAADNGLALRVAMPVLPTAPLITHDMKAATATAIFPGRGDRVRLAGTVRKTTAAAEWLDLTVNGAFVSRVAFGAAAGLHQFETWLPSRVGGNTLELRRPADASAELVFTRLVIDDGGGAPPP